MKALWQLEVDHQQRHRHGKHAIGQGVETHLSRSGGTWAASRPPRDPRLARGRLYRHALRLEQGNLGLLDFLRQQRGSGISCVHWLNCPIRIYSISSNVGPYEPLASWKPK